MNQLTKWYGLALLAPALLPLFYIEGMMYPLLAPKTLLLRALALLALALFAYLALAGKEFYWQRLQHWQTWLPAALLTVAYIASALGVDFYHSFWSTFERGDGLLTLSAGVLYFYLILLSVDAAWLSCLFKTVAWVGSLAALYVVLQWIGVVAGIDLPFITQHSGRLGGTLGNAAFFSAYASMAFFATLWAAREYAGAWRWFLYIGAALQLVAILLAATRGTMLALLGVGFAFLAYLAWRGSGRVRGYARGSLVALLVLAGLFFSFRGTLSEAPFEPVRRLASISLTDSTVASRLFIWKNMASAVWERPLMGVGAEHVDVLFDRFYDPTLIEEEWFDRSHNVYLDYLGQFGIIGLALYLALILLLLSVGWRIHRGGDRMGLFLIGIGAVYALQNFFVFDTGVTLWLFLALTGAALARASASAPAALSPRPLIGFGIGIVSLLLIIPVTVTPWRANLLAFEAYLYQVADVPRANAATEKGLALSTYADLEFGYNAYFIYTEEQLRRLTGAELQLAYENARGVLARNLTRYSYDARTAVYLAQVLASAPATAPGDSELLTTALASALEASPRRPQSWYILANLSISEANWHPAGSRERAAGYAAAVDVLTQYTEEVPGLAEPYFVLAQLEYARGNRAAAAEEAAKGKERYSADLGAARRAVQYYETVLDLPNAAFFLREVLRFHPEDENARADLEQIEAYERTQP